MNLSNQQWILLILCFLCVVLFVVYVTRITKEGFATGRAKVFPTFLDVTSKLPEVFLAGEIVSTSSYIDEFSARIPLGALDMAQRYCNSKGFELATYSQVAAAGMNGADWGSNGGFVVDRQELYYPCKTGSNYVCQIPLAKDIYGTPQTVMSGKALCYGIKPSTGSGYSNFNSSNYSQFSGFNNSAPEVFLVTKTGEDITKHSEASALCASFPNTRLATLGELNSANLNGAHWCFPGWVADDTRDVYNTVAYYESAFCNINGVNKQVSLTANLPLNGGVAWFDASTKTLPESIQTKSIPSLFPNTSPLTVIGSPTLKTLSPTSLPLYTMTHNDGITMTPGTYTKWSLVFLARHTATRDFKDSKNTNHKKHGSIFTGIGTIVQNGITVKCSQNTILGHFCLNPYFGNSLKQVLLYTNNKSFSPSNNFFDGRVLYSSNDSDTSWALVTITFDGTDHNMWWNDVHIVTNVRNTMIDPKAFQGVAVNAVDAADVSKSNCELAEFLVYNRAINNDERLQIESYMNMKWLLGTASSGTAYTNMKQVSFSSAYPRGATCIGMKPFPASQQTPGFNVIGPVNLYKTIASNININPFNRDLFSQKYTTVKNNRAIDAGGSQSTIKFIQQCTYMPNLLNLSSISGTAMWLCDTSAAAKYVSNDISIGANDNVCVFTGDRNYVNYSCKDRGPLAKSNPDGLRYQMVDDLNTLCEKTARLYIDLSGAYGIQLEEQNRYISTISTMSSMVGVLQSTNTTKCKAGSTNPNCPVISRSISTVQSSIKVLETKLQVLQSISTVSTLQGITWLRRNEFQCYNYGV
jgi:hypothetical protein